jgi:hypothetical protein
MINRSGLSSLSNTAARGKNAMAGRRGEDQEAEKSDGASLRNLE